MEAVLGAPFGHVRVSVREGKLKNVDLSPGEREDDVPEGFPWGVETAFRAYLEGKAGRPEMPVDPGIEATPFQRDVWEGLGSIPPGEPRTYGEHAKAIGRPGAARAVGQALARNPVPLRWPCHRVVASDGLGGFGGCSGEDLEAQEKIGVKRWLLDHEETLVERWLAP